uniref:Uncharacterized protein n=1 Tax=Caenorhabditis japonica TaxID=281687 RepID=A0A8R1ISU9_CAEJA
MVTQRSANTLQSHRKCIWIQLGRSVTARILGCFVWFAVTTEEEDGQKGKGKAAGRARKKKEKKGERRPRWLRKKRRVSGMDGACGGWGEEKKKERESPSSRRTL